MAREKCKPWIPSGKQIEEKMAEMGIKQIDLAIMTGISQPMLSGIINEKKDTCTRNMKKIIHVLWY